MKGRCEYNQFIHVAFQCHFLHLYHIITSYLPLSLLLGQELVQCSNNLLQRREVRLQLLLNLGVVLAKLGVEVLPVRCGAHGGAEERLDDEGVVGLECAGIGLAEGVGELLGGVGEVVAEGLGGEVEAAGAGRVSDGWSLEKGETYRLSQTRPSVAVCFFSLSSLRTRSWRVSESVGAASWRSRIFWRGSTVLCCCVVYADSYLDVAGHVALDWLESCGAQNI